MSSTSAPQLELGLEKEFSDALDNFYSRANNDDGETDSALKRSVPPPASLENAAVYVSTAITAMFVEESSSEHVRFIVRLAPEIFDEEGRDYFFDDANAPFKLTISRVPARLAEAPPEFQTFIFLYVVCEAYIAQVRATNPGWNEAEGDSTSAARTMAMNALEIEPEYLIEARKRLWN